MRNTPVKENLPEELPASPGLKLQKWSLMCQLPGLVVLKGLCYFPWRFSASSPTIRNFAISGNTGEVTHPLHCLTWGQGFTAQGRGALPYTMARCCSEWRLALLAQITTLPHSSVLSLMLFTFLWQPVKLRVSGVSTSQISLEKDLVVLELVEKRQAQHDAGWRQGRSRGREGNVEEHNLPLQVAVGYYMGLSCLVASQTEAPSLLARDRLMTN